jgi:hypothetical protein
MSPKSTSMAPAGAGGHNPFYPSEKAARHIA